MGKRNVQFHDWMAEQKGDPQFRAAYDGAELGYQVARLRIMRGLTQAELAERVGTKQPSIARLESGKTLPRVSFLRRVVAALDGEVGVQIVPREVAQEEAVSRDRPETGTSLSNLFSQELETTLGCSFAEIETALHSAGVQTVEELLEGGATAQGRKTLAQRTGLSGKRILSLLNIADLFRVTGIGQVYACLLTEVGVDTVPELAQRNPENLYKTISKTNEERDLVRRLPSVSAVGGWIDQAKALPRAIRY